MKLLTRYPGKVFDPSLGMAFGEADRLAGELTLRARVALSNPHAWVGTVFDHYTMRHLYQLHFRGVDVVDFALDFDPDDGFGKVLALALLLSA